MNPLVTIAVAIIGSGATASIVTLISDAIKRRWKKQDEKETKLSVTPELISKLTKKLDAVVESQKVITTERIRYLGSCYIYAGEITLEDKETLHQMHGAYELLGGNGRLDTVMEEVDKLPVVKEKVEK